MLHLFFTLAFVAMGILCLCVICCVVVASSSFKETPKQDGK